MAWQIASIILLMVLVIPTAGQPVGNKGEVVWWEEEDGISPLNVKEERPQLELGEEIEEEEDRDLLEWEEEKDLFKEVKHHLEKQEEDLVKREEERDILKKAKHLWEKEKKRDRLEEEEGEGRDGLEREVQVDKEGKEGLEREVEKEEEGRDGLEREVQEEKMQLMQLEEEVERLWQLVEQTKREVQELYEEGQRMDGQRRRNQETQASHTTPLRQDNRRPDKAWYHDTVRGEGILDELAPWEKTPEPDGSTGPDTQPDEEPLGFDAEM